MRSNAFLNIENNDEYCFLWSKLANLRPCKNNHPNRVSYYKQYFNELNNNGFDITNEVKCSDEHIFEKQNNLSLTIFELNFYQDQKKWRQKLLPIEVSKTNQIELLTL